MLDSSSVSLINLISQADIVVQSVILFLALASIWSWSIVFDKLVSFRIISRRMKNFDQAFQSGGEIEDIYKLAKSDKIHPLATIFISCMREWSSADIKEVLNNKTGEVRASLKDRLLNAMQYAQNNSFEKLEKGLNHLAIIGSAAPFIGLFGTVWGIMNSFQGIAVSKNTSLAVVAPGITEALLATAIGLFAAIPAVFFYNIFSSNIQKISERSENFSIQLLNLFSRELDNNSVHE